MKNKIHQAMALILTGLLMCSLFATHVTTVYADDLPEEDLFVVEEEAGEAFVEETVAEGTLIEADLPDDDTLLTQYMQVVASDMVDEELMGTLASAYVPKNTARYQNLGDAEKKAYLIVREALSEIASGKRSDTIIEVPFEDIFPSSVCNMTFTAADLGLSSLTDANGNLLDEVYAAVDAHYAFDTEAMFRALSADCPELLFWFDKTSGNGMQSSGSYTISGVQGSIDQIWESCYYFAFCVSNDYLAGTTGENAAYTANTTKIGSVQTAMTYAASIVTGVKSYSDYKKLVAYKDRVCKEVSYNKATEGMAYGDPWQIIYVFDQNKNTNVVCEGYSKAFKYLCDLTTFAGNVGCHIVTGQMDGGTGAGDHMWNIVRINNQSYLVDVTNCDDGTIGNPDKLFLKGIDTTTGANNKTAKQYAYKIGSTIVAYAYDTDTTALFSAAERTLAATDYTETAPTPTPKPTATPTPKPTATPTPKPTATPTPKPTATPTPKPTATPTPTPIPTVKVTVPTAKNLTYNGKNQTGVAAGDEYTVSGGTATNAGTYTATVSLKNIAGKKLVWADGSTASKKITFKIAQKKITPAVTLRTASYVYDGKVKTPGVTVKDGKTNLAASQYAISYQGGRKNVGRYNVKVTLKGNYTGTKTVTLQIIPKGTSLKKATAASKATTVTWNKQTAKMASARITGYQIQVATNTKFNQNAKTVTVKGYNSSSRKITGLKGKTKYYVRIRTYTTTGGKTYYSPWSATKTVTTKK